MWLSYRYIVSNKLFFWTVKKNSEFRGNLDDWRIGLIGISERSGKRNAKSSSWGGITPYTSTAWCLLGEKQLCREGPCGPKGHQAEKEPTLCPCSKDNQIPSGLNQEKYQRVKGGGASPLFCTSETCLQCYVQVWALKDNDKRDMDTVDGFLQRAVKIFKVWEQIWYQEWLRQLGLFGLEKIQSRIFWKCINTW